MYFSPKDIEQLIIDDLPYDDLTTNILGIDGNCKAEFRSRQDIMVCSTEEAKTILECLNVSVDSFLPSGSLVKETEVLLCARGNFKDLQKSYRICSNLLEHACGIATKAKKFVDLARCENPNIRIATTRKTFPFAKKLVLKAVILAGAQPHRLGLSESILIFKEHITFMGGFKQLLKNFDTIKRKAYDKLVCVEVQTLEEAILIAKAGADIIQLDKFGIEETKEATFKIKSFNSNIKISVAGGINDKNVLPYVRTGIDAIVTSWLYFSRPADIGVNFIKTD